MVIAFEQVYKLDLVFFFYLATGFPRIYAVLQLFFFHPAAFDLRHE